MISKLNTLSTLQWFLGVNQLGKCILSFTWFYVFSVFVVLRSLFGGSCVFSVHVNGSGSTPTFSLKRCQQSVVPYLALVSNYKSVGVTAQHNLHVIWLIKTAIFF